MAKQLMISNDEYLGFSYCRDVHKKETGLGSASLKKIEIAIKAYELTKVKKESLSKKRGRAVNIFATGLLSLMALSIQGIFLTGNLNIILVLYLLVATISINRHNVDLKTMTSILREQEQQLREIVKDEFELRCFYTEEILTGDSARSMRIIEKYIFNVTYIALIVILVRYGASSFWSPQCLLLFTGVAILLLAARTARAKVLGSRKTRIKTIDSTELLVNMNQDTNRKLGLT